MRELTTNEQYAEGILKKYGTAEEHQKKEKEKPSEHKLSLLKNFPISLDGPFEASIIINDNCDIIFVTPRGISYYDTVPNKLIAKFKIKNTEQ